ncbi:hypothetical protein ABH942_002946 [Flavobacterium sp. 28YEA47A]|uniref:hypothetical protein n=1 Tax=Flavobacterium sp. 28YEA47A TaxID=3156276 RepID=UPI003514C2C8
MKKIILNLSILTGLMLISCERADLPQEQNASNDNSLTLRQRQSSMFSYIQSARINNDVNCENNILIFPSWNHYWETIDRLDQMVERECDAFDSNVPNNISEDRYNALADAVGFDENNTLRRFEEDLAFCSLRRKIERLETAWLNRQGDRDWDATTDPDNHFIGDPAERTLLSANAEVIIGDEKKGYVYYKFLDDKGNRIEVLNNDRDAISQVSQGKIPSNNPNVVVVNPGRVSAYNCASSVSQNVYEFSGIYRFKRTSEVTQATWFTPSKIISKTIGYKKINGVWKRARLLIAVGINGQNRNASGLAYINCIQERSIHLYKERKRRQVTVKTVNTANIPIIGVPRNFTFQDNKLFSYHKRGPLSVNKDFYDMANF